MSPLDKRAVRELRITNEFNKIKEEYPSGGEIEVIAMDRDKCTMTVRFNIRTILSFGSTGPVYRDTSIVDISLPSDYPEGTPLSIMRDQQPWHPNWYTDRRWCSGHYKMVEPLWEYIRRMGETIRFNPSYTNPDSPANKYAVPDWNAAGNKIYFPVKNTFKKSSGKITIRRG